MLDLKAKIRLSQNRDIQTPEARRERLVGDTRTVDTVSTSAMAIFTFLIISHGDEANRRWNRSTEDRTYSYKATEIGEVEPR